MAEGRRGRWTTTTGREENIAAAMNNGYVGYTICLSVCLSFCLPHAGYGGGTTTRKMVAAQEDNMCIAEESTLAILPVCCLFLLLSFCCLPHAGYGGGQRRGGRRQDERTTSPKNVRWLYYLCVVFIGFFNLSCWLWWKDNDEVGTRGQHVHR